MFFYLLIMLLCSAFDSADTTSRKHAHRQVELARCLPCMHQHFSVISLHLISHHEGAEMAPNHTAPGNIRGLSSLLTATKADGRCSSSLLRFKPQRSEPRVSLTSHSTPFSSLYGDTNTTGFQRKRRPRGDTTCLLITCNCSSVMAAGSIKVFSINSQTPNCAVQQFGSA